MRFAAGVALISASLLIGSSGAVAWADTDSDAGASESSSTGQSQGSEAPSDGGIKAGPPTKPSTDPVRTTLRNVTTAIHSLPKLIRQQSTAQKPAQLEPTAKTTSTDKSDATTDSDAASAESTAVAPDENVVTSDPNGAGPDSHTTPLANISLPPVSPPSNPLPPVPPIVKPVTNAVSAVANVALSVPGTIATISTSPTPVTDVITSLQQILTDTVTPLVQASSDLTSLLLGAAATIPETTPVAGAPGGIGVGAATPTIALAPVKQLDPAQVPLFAGFPVTANLPAPDPLFNVAPTALSRQLVSGTQSTTLDAATQSALGDFIEHVVGALLAPASLQALAALALPGVLGLLIVGAAGMRIGYRQAKAMLEARISGIAAFAGAGPLGVVRSGSLIALHSRTSRVRTPDPARTAGLPEQVAS